MDRKQWLKLAAATVVGASFPSLSFASSKNKSIEEQAIGNFQYVLSDEALTDQFKSYLDNVFTLYDANDLIQLIYKQSMRFEDDFRIYSHAQP